MSLHQVTEEFDDVRAERDRLREALREYGSHTMSCLSRLVRDGRVHEARSCSCGFADVLGSSPEPPPAVHSITDSIDVPESFEGGK